MSLHDVGFGVSQLLPIIVQSLTKEPQTILLEQPELHIHPRLQADLGNLFAEGALERQKQFIIETHSEHLVLRLQRLVREGKLFPEEISILYVSPGGEGSVVTPLRLDEDGDFIDEWPDGFFPERLREIFPDKSERRGRKKRVPLTRMRRAPEKRRGGGGGGAGGATPAGAPRGRVGTTNEIQRRNMRARLARNIRRGQ